ncbi:hypothetical protein FQN57_004048 [Myotisia sp. PD_48]|nr:hypothetical protein FQN57_004048 [Myotisia sp. PD_48]
MPTSTAAYKLDGNNPSRRGHAPHISISDENHHVTEAIGYMYNDAYDDRDSRRLSYISSSQEEKISTNPVNRAGTAASPSNSDRHLLPIRTSSIDRQKVNGQPHNLPHIDQPLSISANAPQLSLDLSPTSPDQNHASYPLNDIDYQTDAATVAQELSKLAALRRMSMDLGAIDPDMPAFGGLMPSIAPSASDDEDDTSRLFWVPAHIHPGLAPKEFKTFLDGKADQIKRRSGELSPVEPVPGLQRKASSGGLVRKNSLLSRQVDRSSVSTGSQKRSNLASLAEESSNKSNVLADEDKPILPPAPPGHSLRRSTRTTYRKGSLKSGEGSRYSSRRAARQSDTGVSGEPNRLSTSTDDPPILGLTRVSTDPTPMKDSSTNYSRPARTKPLQSSSSLSAPSPNRARAPSLTQPWKAPENTFESPSHNTSVSQKPQQAVEPPRIDSRLPAPTNPIPPQPHIPERNSSHNPPPSLPPQAPLPPEPTNARNSKRAAAVIPPQQREPAYPANEIPPSFGNNTRTDNLTYIPTLLEDKRPESKKPKDKKDSDSGKKSGWHWRRGGSEDKKKDEDTKRSKSKSAKSSEKIYDSARLDVLQSSIDRTPKGRESLVFDRSDNKFEDDDRRKEGSRKTSSTEPKKEKESGIFSSIFGSSRKKTHESHKKHTRHLSPEPRLRFLKPDIDYNWTRFSILEERAIYRMAHIKLANPRRALYSQVLLSNFMYSYLAKVQQMHPHMSLPTSPAQNQQQKKKEQQQQQQHPEEYTQYQRYQQSQEQDSYGSNSGYGDSHNNYDYDLDDRDDHQSAQHHSPRNQSYDNGSSYGSRQHSHGSYTGNDSHLDDDDDMW